MVAKISKNEVDFLLRYLIGCLAPAPSGLDSLSLKSVRANTPTFSFLGKSWGLGTIFGSSDLTWGEFEELFNEVLHDLINKGPVAWETTL